MKINKSVMLISSLLMASGQSLAGDELINLGIVVNSTPSVDIYANGQMQAEVTVFWEFIDDVAPEDAVITSIELLDYYSREDVDVEGWNYKHDGGDFIAENQYEHVITSVYENSKTNDALFPKDYSSTDDDKRISGYQNLYLQSSQQESKIICVRVTSKSGSTYETCDNDIGLEQTITVNGLEPHTYDPASYSITFQPAQTPGRARFHYIDILTSDPAFNGAVYSETDRDYVNINSPIREQKEAITYWYNLHTGDMSSSGIYNVDPNTTSLSMKYAVDTGSYYPEFSNVAMTYYEKTQDHVFRYIVAQNYSAEPGNDQHTVLDAYVYPNDGIPRLCQEMVRSDFNGYYCVDKNGNAKKSPTYFSYYDIPHERQMKYRDQYGSLQQFIIGQSPGSTDVYLK